MTLYKEERFNRESVLDIKTPFKPTEIFQYSFYTTCYPLGAKCFAKGRALSLLRKNSSKKFSQNTTGRERQR